MLREPSVTYQDRLNSHLANFKRLHLRIDEPGVFRHHGRDLLRDHILPAERADANLLPEAAPGAAAFFAAHPTKRHRYFHHLNSSQAFAFNLFFPFFSGSSEAATALLRALGQEGVLREWEPEAVPVPNEESNIDVCWTTVDGVRTFCEVKLSEAEFGQCADDEAHHDKLRNIYRDVLAGHLEPGRLEPAAFFAAYQFNRNVWHMVRTDRSRLLFLLPRSNAPLWAQLQALLSGVLPDTRERISAVAIEDVIACLCRDALCPPASREYALTLKQKYVPDNG